MGLVCYNGLNFTTYSTSDGLADNLVSALWEDLDGNLWLGTLRGVTMFNGSRFVSITELSDNAFARVLGHCWVSAICEDTRERLWFGTGSEWNSNGQGVICLDDGTFSAYNINDGLAGNDILSICEDHNGNLWFGTQDGVSMFDGDHFTTYTTRDGLMGNFAMSICEDRQERLWVGCGGGWFSGGASVFDGKNFIPFTAEYFYQRTCKKLKKELKGFAPGVLDMLSSHRWHGNVRELEHAVEAACILAPSGSEIQTYHFPELTQEKSLAQEIISKRLGYNESVMQFRRQLVESALKECDGNRTHAAKLLGMKRSNLVHLIRDMELDK